MKNLLRNGLSLLLAILMLISVFPLYVFAEEDGDNIDIETDINGGITDDDLEEDETDYFAATCVYSSEELEEALELSEKVIKICASFEIDRTFYVSSDAVIFADEAVTLTRADDFAGDVFVVGEDKDKNAYEGVRFQLGRDDSEKADLLTVDGNKNGMTVDVVGTVIFACNDATVKLYGNLTVKNCMKTANERTLDEKYGLSYSENVGGAVAISAGSTFSVYGGRYANNECNCGVDGDNLASSYGGAFFFFGDAKIYGGSFEDNCAYRGGAFYVYRTLKMYGGNIIGNSATTNGGAIYMPASTLSYLYIDVDEENGTFVTLNDNEAGENGGAVYAQGVLVKITGATFGGNKASVHGGAIYSNIASTGKGDIKVTVTDTKFSGNTAGENGGVIYLTGSAAYFENADFSLNYAKATENASGNRYGGGAIYSTGSYVEINGATFDRNTSDYNGGAVALYTSSSAVMNNVSATGNSSQNAGGFVYANKSDIKVYNSSIKENSAKTTGGAASLGSGASVGAYMTSFEKNSAGSNGGALYVYTDGTQSIAHSCLFIGNTSLNFGGAIYVSKASLLDVYNATVKNNSALSGGFMYETTSATTVTLNGISLSGNTATNGPIIYGNTTKAVLKLNKANYFDLDATAALDDAYFNTAIANQLTVEEITTGIPGYADYGSSDIISPDLIVNKNVTSAAELQAALAAGVPEIYIYDDFKLDRTFYVTSSVTLYSSGNHTLTRSDSFGGDIFVIGQNADGELCKEEITFNVKTDAESGNLLIDGNKDNMKTEVYGTVFFVCDDAKLVLNEGITVKNCNKTANERTLDEKYGLSYPERIGGAVTIVAKGGSLDVYGGEYSSNSTNPAAEDGTIVSGQGGAFYLFGNTNIYGGRFVNNSAARGGAIYNYRTLYIYNAELCGNSANEHGGAIYMAASTLANLYLGKNTYVTKSRVLFEDNSSVGNGGAICAYGAYVEVENTVFKENASGNHGGAVYVNIESNDDKDVKAMLVNAVFEGNVTDYNGGALYLTGTNARIEYSSFESNSAKATANDSGNRYGGGAIYSTGSYTEIIGTSFTDNISDNNGGAIALYSSSRAVMFNISASGNSALGQGGAIYSNSHSDIYNSRFNNNVAKNGGAISFKEKSSGNVYSSSFEGNDALGDGGALYVYTDGAKVLVHTTAFKDNTSVANGGAVYVSKASILDLVNNEATGNGAAKGGFMYETTTDTTVTLNGITLFGNTATDGGAIIWGNTAKAILKINKASYKDLDASGKLDDAYFAQAIANKLTVNEINDEMSESDEYGNEAYESMKDAIDVSSSAQLENAIKSGARHIRIVSDFEIDRTFFISSDVTVFATAPHRLLRDADFGGDIFVVGEKYDGTSALLDGTDAKLTLGNPASETENLLVIDGNCNNMTADVNGTVLFVCNSAEVSVYSGVTFANSCKEGNERTHFERYVFSRPNRVGGAVAIIESGAMNVYGGNFKNNSVNAESVTVELDDSGKNSTLGGVIYSYGELNIYGGNFENNFGHRGGVLYNYKIAHVYGGSFKNNRSSGYGGALYMNNSAYSNMYIGTGGAEDEVFFIGNTSESSGGAMYIGGMAATVIYGNTVFEANVAEKSNGGAIYCKGVLIARDTDFSQNSAKNRGGAVYVSSYSAENTTRICTLEGCTFDSNKATTGGAIAVYTADTSMPEGGKVNISNCSFVSNKAANRIGTSSVSEGYGGALFASYRSDVNVTGSEFSFNSAESEGGAIYVAMETVLDVSNSTFESNEAYWSEKGYGGAISLHSSTVSIDSSSFDLNEANRGGAVYISYNSASNKNSAVKIVNSDFTGNSVKSYGGAIYATRRAIDGYVGEDLAVRDSTFMENTSSNKGGVIYMSGGTVAYIKDSVFKGNEVLESESGHNGGVIYTTGSSVEINGAEFTENKAGSNGAVLGLYASSKAVLNGVNASDNAAIGSAGFAMVDSSSLDIYGGKIERCSAGANGGAISMVDMAVVNIYGTDFTGNTSVADGGALYVYTGGSDVSVFDSEFIGNVSGRNGGALYVSNKSLLHLYNIKATENSAVKGGFMYETTSKTAVDLIGVTLSGNTATDGGAIIWGNTTGAVLNLNKARYSDLDVGGALDSEYFAGAIANKLTVNECDASAPTYSAYKDTHTESGATTTSAKAISVAKVFSLAEKSSENSINAVYGALEKLDNSSNFMSRNATEFENINGETVTVDTFVYHKHDTANHPTVGEGILIYQAMLYKKEHPEADVSISLSTFRMAADAGVCINRNSRYFGYMRRVASGDYDSYGFVRVSALLVAAAKMGINVTVIAQLDGYPAGLKIKDYFESVLSAACDSNYVENGKISDYLTFKKCYWTSYGDKDATDMMHTKLCTVSHYIDKDGVEHKNAIWSSSTNLDGVETNAKSGNNKLQTATIVSDHAELYRVAKNYHSLIADHCEQEDVYIFRDIVISRSTEQIDLLLAGRGDEIPRDEQIVYVGTENDDVFELYFAPLGGDVARWEENYNPICKSLRALKDSDDYIMLTWNNVKFTRCSAAAQFAQIIDAAFHENKDVDNRLYVNLSMFDTSVYSDLKVGRDIGYMSLNEYHYGELHSKDLQVSYSENGQRHYVSLLNSCNIHGGSMAYQSNFILVIDEKELTEDSVFFTLAELTTKGVVDHNYGKEIVVEATENEHGYTYYECTECGLVKSGRVVHLESEWIRDLEATEVEYGVCHKECLLCSMMLSSGVIDKDGKILRYVVHSFEDGARFEKLDDTVSVTRDLDAAPHTFEILFNLPTGYSGRGGVLVGNYDGGTGDAINIEIYNSGQPRLYFKASRVGYSYLFNYDVRSDGFTHMTITVDGLVASLYVNGEFKESVKLTKTVPDTVDDFTIGGDCRTSSPQLFGGTVYAVNMFSSVRSAEEIARDSVMVAEDAESLVYSWYIGETEPPKVPEEPEEPKDPVLGDIDGDGAVTLLDAMAVINAVLNSDQIGDADINGDGRLSLADVLRVFKLTVK